MDDYRQQQVEALQVAHEYSGKLMNGIKNVVGELQGNRLLDTDAYLDEVVKGINWIIEIVNRTMDVINENEVLVEKESVNDAVNKLADALSKKDDALIADALSNGMLQFIERVEMVTAGF